MKRTLIILLLILLACCLEPATAHAQKVTRYTTRTTCLRNRAKGRTVIKARRGTPVKLLKTGKVWAKIRHNGQTLYCRKKWLHKDRPVNKYTGAYFRRAGVIHWHGYKFTWYSQRVLAGGGLKIPSRHVDRQGFICDKDGYICLGSNTANRGRLIATPFGKYGKVYDAGFVDTYWFDCYTDF